MVQLSFEIIQLILISVMKLFDIPRTVAWRLASNSKDGDGARSPLARGFGSPADHLRLENSSKCCECCPEPQPGVNGARGPSTDGRCSAPGGVTGGRGFECLFIASVGTPRVVSAKA